MKNKLKNNHNMLFRLFLSTLYISAFTFGGGYVIVSLMKKKFVDDYHWIDENEMLDFVAIAQSAPGPIAINGAIVVGYRLANILGIGITILATVIPPFVIISVISFFYNAFEIILLSVRCWKVCRQVSVPSLPRLPGTWCPASSKIKIQAPY